MLDLLYHKHHYLLITILVGSSIFRKSLRLWLEQKMSEKEVDFYPDPRYYNDKIIIDTKTYIPYGWKAFWIRLHQKRFC